MALTLNLKTPISTEPISLTDAKNYLRVDIGDDDTLISGLITSAREYCEVWTKRALGTQSWALLLDDFPSDRNFIDLPRPPLQSIESVVYKNSKGQTFTIDPTSILYDYDSEPGRIVLAYNRYWPIYIPYPSKAVIINYTAGYSDPNPVPTSIKQAMYILMAQWYEDREPWVEKRMTELSHSVESLLIPYCVETLRWG